MACSLPPGGWLTVTCGLTACTPGSAPGPTLRIEYGKPLPFTLSFEIHAHLTATISTIYNSSTIFCCFIFNLALPILPDRTMYLVCQYKKLERIQQLESWNHTVTVHATHNLTQVERCTLLIHAWKLGHVVNKKHIYITLQTYPQSQCNFAAWIHLSCISWPFCAYYSLFLTWTFWRLRQRFYTRCSNILNKINHTNSQLNSDCQLQTNSSVTECCNLKLK